jgi:hypothetical protein
MFIVTLFWNVMTAVLLQYTLILTHVGDLIIWRSATTAAQIPADQAAWFP